MRRKQGLECRGVRSRAASHPRRVPPGLSSEIRECSLHAAKPAGFAGAQPSLMQFPRGRLEVCCEHAGRPQDQAVRRRNPGDRFLARSRADPHVRRQPEQFSIAKPANGCDTGMTRREGKITRADLRQIWPHHVALPKLSGPRPNRPSITLNVPGSAVSDRDLPICVFFRR
jgi:hypothetical protein